MNLGGSNIQTLSARSLILKTRVQSELGRSSFCARQNITRAEFYRYLHILLLLLFTYCPIPIHQFKTYTT
jgi:hypothetical protein